MDPKISMIDEDTCLGVDSYISSAPDLSLSALFSLLSLARSGASLSVTTFLCWPIKYRIPLIFEQKDKLDNLKIEDKI